jgi:hypothetical protein
MSLSPKPTACGRNDGNFAHLPPENRLAAKWEFRVKIAPWQAKRDLATLRRSTTWKGFRECR